MLVFIHINKTAGRTVRWILRSSYGMRHCEAEPWHGSSNGPFSAADLRRLRRIYPRMASLAGHRVTGYADLDSVATDLRYFTFVRDPVKLTASRFQYHVDYRNKPGLVFEEWLEREWLRNPQTKQIGGGPDVEAALRAIERKDIFVGLTEHFDESLVLLKNLRAPDLDTAYTPVNVAKRGTLAKELLADRKTREAIAEANAADVALYEHVRSELYPRFVREYGPSLDAAVDSFRDECSDGFNSFRLTASRAKQYGLYRPLLRVYRKPSMQPIVGRLLG